jgi:hypothetical protein
MTEPSARGSNGGKARKEKLSPERRKEIGKLAAAKRWAKKVETAPNAEPFADLPVQESHPIPSETQEYHCPACLNGQTLEKGEGTHVLATVEHPAYSLPTTTVPTPLPEPPKTIQRRRKPMVKEFGKAYSRAEKLLEEALKKRSEAVKIIIACNEDIPMYVNVIKSLGGTVDPQAMRAVDIRSLDVTSAAQNMNLYQPPQYQHPHTIPSQDVNPIDPALYATNTNPLPGLSPAIANAPVVLNKPLGGAIDLGYTPVDEDEGPGLPKMGGGWA